MQLHRIETFVRAVGLMLKHGKSEEEIAAAIPQMEEMTIPIIEMSRELIRNDPKKENTNFRR